MFFKVGKRGLSVEMRHHLVVRIRKIGETSWIVSWWTNHIVWVLILGDWVLTDHFDCSILSKNYRLIYGNTASTPSALPFIGVESVVSHQITHFHISICRVHKELIGRIRLDFWRLHWVGADPTLSTSSLSIYSFNSEATSFLKSATSLGSTLYVNFRRNHAKFAWFLAFFPI